MTPKGLACSGLYIHNALDCPLLVAPLRNSTLGSRWLHLNTPSMAHIQPKHRQKNCDFDIAMCGNADDLQQKSSGEREHEHQVHPGSRAGRLQ